MSSKFNINSNNRGADPKSGQLNSGPGRLRLDQDPIMFYQQLAPAHGDDPVTYLGLEKVGENAQVLWNDGGQGGS